MKKFWPVVWILVLMLIFSGTPAFAKKDKGGWSHGEENGWNMAGKKHKKKKKKNKKDKKKDKKKKKKHKKKKKKNIESVAPNEPNAPDEPKETVPQQVPPL